MSDDAETAEKGLEEAHTRRGPGEIGAKAPELPTGAELAQAVRDHAAEIAQADDAQLDLIEGMLDLATYDGLEQVAETSSAQRRARGRPKGSANRRNTLVFELLEAKGHRDMAETLSAIQSADTVDLANYLGAPMRDSKGRVIRTPVRDHAGELVRDADGELVMEVVYAAADPVKVLAIQRQAAADLMGYKYAKKPQAIELPPQVQRPVMNIGTMNVQQNNQTFMSAGGEIEGNQALSEAQAVRLPGDESHEDSQVVDVAGESGADPTD